MRSRLPSFFALALSLLLIPPAFAMDTPLSDEAVRDAYFLGQRHEQDFTDLLAKYTKPLPVPESGPDISSVTFLTPFALVAQLSSQRTMNYSAQQAEQDHRNSNGNRPRHHRDSAHGNLWRAHFSPAGSPHRFSHRLRTAPLRFLERLPGRRPRQG